MLISEIYESKQGEGLLTGTPSIFIRTSGCNLRCSFCDTPFTSWNPSGQPYSVEEIVRQTRQYASQHVVITGGEPMLPREVEPLTELLRNEDYHITIETAGTVYRDLQCDLMSISPKLSNSDPPASRAGAWAERHRSTRLELAVSSLVTAYAYQLKFVVAAPPDVSEIVEFLQLHGLPTDDRVLLMPEGVDQESLKQKAGWLEPLAVRHGFRFCPRKHIEWYGNTRGT